MDGAAASSAAGSRDVSAAQGATHTAVQALAQVMGSSGAAGGANLASLNANIAALRSNQQRVRDERKRLAKELKNAQRRKKRLKTKARQLSNDDLLAVLLMREEASADNAENTSGPSSGAACSAAGQPAPAMSEGGGVASADGM